MADDGLVRIEQFEPRYQQATATLINKGLGERFGFIDESMNPDLYDIASNYADATFLLAMVNQSVVGTGALISSEPSCGQIVRMHTAANHRRRGIASQILDALEHRATQVGMQSLSLETNLDWDDAIQFYLRSGYAVLDRNHSGIRFQKVFSGGS